MNDMVEMRFSYEVLKNVHKYSRDLVQKDIGDTSVTFDDYADHVRFERECRKLIVKMKHKCSSSELIDNNLLETNVTRAFYDRFLAVCSLCEAKFDCEEPLMKNDG